MTSFPRLFTVGTALAALGTILLFAGFAVPWLHTDPYPTFRLYIPVRYYSPLSMIVYSWVGIGPTLCYAGLMVGPCVLGVPVLLARIGRVARLNGRRIAIGVVSSIVGPFIMLALIPQVVYSVAFDRPVAVVPDVGLALPFGGFVSTLAGGIALGLRAYLMRHTPAEQELV